MSRKRGERHHAWLRLDVAAMVRDYNEGASLDALAYIYRADPKTIRQRLLAAGVTLRPGPPPPVQFQPTLVADYEAGATLRELASEHGCTWVTIQRELIRRGVPRRPAGGSKKGRKHRRAMW